MKSNRFLTICLILMTLPATAQITQNNWLVGGEAYFRNVSTEAEFEYGIDTHTSTSVSVRPKVGYFIVDKLALGIEVAVSYNRRHGGVNNSNVIYEVGPFARYYLLDADKMINVLVGGFYTYGSNTENVSIKSNSFGFMGGLVLFVTNTVGFEFLVGYQYFTQHSHTPVKWSTIQTGLGLQIHLEK